MYCILIKISTDVFCYHGSLKTVIIRKEKPKTKLEGNDVITGIFKKAESDETKWNIISDSGNSIKFTQIICLKNCFKDLINENNKMAQFLNYKMSKLGE